MEPVLLEGSVLDAVEDPHWECLSESEGSIRLSESADSDNIPDIAHIGQMGYPSLQFQLESESSDSRGGGLSVPDDSTLDWDAAAVVRQHFPHGQAMLAACRVLVLNVYWALKKLPRSILKDICMGLGTSESATHLEP